MGCPRISGSQLLHRCSASIPTLIDTRKAFRQLQEEEGFSDAQADAIVDIFTDVDEQVATKGDIERLDSKIESLEDRMDQRFEALEERMDQRFAEVDQRFESLEVRMDQRFESLRTEMDQRFESVEERMGHPIQKVRNSIVASVAAVGAVLAVVIPLSVYFFG
jgi:DNA repair exonuclease SbcCD ATPase subunit